MPFSEADFSNLCEVLRRIAYGTSLACLRDYYLAEDVILLSLWRRLRNGNPRSDIDDPRNWVAGGARYAALRVKYRRMREIPAGTVEQQGPQAESGIDLLDLIATIPRNYREVFYRRFILGEPILEIASSVNVSSGTIKWRLHRCREILADALGR